MSTYLQEYFKNILKSKIQILVLSLILPVPMVFMPNNHLGMILKITMLVLILFLRGKIVPSKKQYRNIEKYLLPVNDIELLILTYFENFILLFPFATVVINGIFLFISVDEKIKTSQKENFILVVLSTFVITLIGPGFRLVNELGIEFHKIDKIKRIRQAIRWLGSYLIVASFGTYLLVIDANKTHFPYSIIFACSLLIWYFLYVFICREKTIFNEHKKIGNLSFRPMIDIPASMAVFLFCCLMSLVLFMPNNLDKRKPASISTVHVNPK